MLEWIGRLCLVDHLERVVEHGRRCYEEHKPVDNVECVGPHLDGYRGEPAAERHLDGYRGEPAAERHLDDVSADPRERQCGPHE